MSGAANFPGSLDTDGSLYDVTDGVSYPQAAHHNNIKEAVKAIEAKLGINNTAVATSIDYRLGNVGGHNHNGASGMGPQINPSTIPAPSGAVASAVNLHDHLMNQEVHPTVLSPSIIPTPDGAVGAPSYLSDHLMAASYHPFTLTASRVFAPAGAWGTPSTLHDHLMATLIHPSGIYMASLGIPTVERSVLNYHWQGSLLASAPLGAPLGIPRTMRVEAVDVRLGVPPSGATTALDVRFGPTSLWEASLGLRPMIQAGGSYYGHASPNLVTYPSGVPIYVDVDEVGSNDPGQYLRITFVFRD